MEPAVAVRVPGRTNAVLEGLAGPEDGAMVALGVGVARLTPSLTKALGRADVDDFREEAESGDVTAARVVVVAGLEVVEEAREDLAGTAPAVGALGTIEALLEGAAGVAVEFCRIGGGIVVLDGADGAADTDFLRDEGAVVAGLVGAAD